MEFDFLHWVFGSRVSNRQHTASYVPTDDLEKTVYKVVNGYAVHRSGGTKPEHNLKNDLGYDSPETTNFICELEDEFGFIIPDVDAQKLTTVQETVDYIRSRVDVTVMGGHSFFEPKKQI